MEPLGAADLGDRRRATRHVPDARDQSRRIAAPGPSSETTGVHPRLRVAGIGSDGVVQGEAVGSEPVESDLQQTADPGDPTRIVHLWQSMYKHAFYRGGEIMTSALSGVEQPIADGQPFEFSFDTQLVNFYPRENAASFYGLAPVGDDLFLDTGIDGVPDGVEQDSAGVVPLPDGDPLTTDDDDPNDDDFAIPGGTGFEGDGVFQEGEPLVDRGQRLIVNPAHPDRPVFRMTRTSPLPVDPGIFRDDP